MILFMGVAGSGKSLQGRMLADALALPWLSTGEFLRMLISGQKRTNMLKGHLLEDQEIIALVQKIFTIVDTNQDFVLDGFPRTATQADWLLNQVKHGQLKVSGVVHIKADEGVVRQRLLERGRLDDTEKAIGERFDEYRRQILPILDQFIEAGVKVYDVNGEQSVEKVHADIMSALRS